MLMLVQACRRPCRGFSSTILAVDLENHHTGRAQMKMIIQRAKKHTDGIFSKAPVNHVGLMEPAL